MTTNRRRLEINARRNEILDAAVTIAARAGGWSSMTREQIAKEAGCSVGLINNYYGTMAQLRRAVMRAAIAREVLPVIAQGLAAGDAHAAKAPGALKHAAVQLLIG